MTEEADHEPGACRTWWRNCAVSEDAEIRVIDRLEDEISPLQPGVARTRELISTLELCHHKAHRWVANIARAIAGGDTAKGLGRRTGDATHPVEQTWQNACAALSAWCDGGPGDAIDLWLGDRPARELLARLGPRSPIKEWQVRRIIERIRGHVGWRGAMGGATEEYVFLLEAGSEYASVLREDCPKPYRDHADFWQQTVQMRIYDADLGDPHSVYGDLGYGERTVLSLATAIDMLWPCHWDHVGNLEIVLGAIGGDPHPQRPFAFCARNIKLSPIREPMRTVSHTLQAFVQGPPAGEDVDAELLSSLGSPSGPRRWLAASLDKTIRLQMDL